jgi:hypothetical protein
VTRLVKEEDGGVVGPKQSVTLAAFTKENQVVWLARSESESECGWVGVARVDECGEGLGSETRAID